MKIASYNINGINSRLESKFWRNLLKMGWTDAIRSLYPDERVYTFWDYLRNAYGRDAGLRPDHFLLDPVLMQRLQSAGADKEVLGWENISDHAPVWTGLRD